MRQPSFCMKFSAEQLLFESFFDTIGIFCSVHQSESTFQFQYIIIYQKWQSLEHPSSIPAGGRGMRPLRFLQEI